MGVIERAHDPVLDQRSDTVLTEFVTEGFRVVFLRGSRVDVGDVQRFDIHESSDFQCPNAVVRAVGVVAARLVAVESSRIDSSVAGAFLG